MKKILLGVNAIRLNVVDLFYRGYTNIEVIGKKVDFGFEAINALYGLENNEIEHVIFKNPKE